MVCHKVAAGVLSLVVFIGTGASVRALGPTPQETKALAAPAAINLNAATVTDLEKLPGVGPAMAAKIIEYRQKAGGFKKIEELMNVQGIGEKNFLKLKPLVTVAASRSAEK